MTKEESLWKCTECRTRTCYPTGAVPSGTCNAPYREGIMRAMWRKVV